MLIGCSPDPTTNSETTNPIYKIRSSLFICCFWLVKFRLHSFVIGCWIWWRLNQNYTAFYFNNSSADMCLSEPAPSLSERLSFQTRVWVVSYRASGCSVSILFIQIPFWSKFLGKFWMLCRLVFFYFFFDSFFLSFYWILFSNILLSLLKVGKSQKLFPFSPLLKKRTNSLSLHFLI